MEGKQPGLAAAIGCQPWPLSDLQAHLRLHFLIHFKSISYEKYIQ